MRRIFNGLARALAAAGLMAGIVGYMVINNSAHYPARWHQDPATIQLRGTPNEYFVAPPGTTAAPTDADTPIYRESPTALLTRFDVIARAQPRTRVVAGDVDGLMITYVQRSRFIGFPDYLTVKAVATEGGAGLIIYSRARYGRSDFGVNRARVEAWMAALGQAGYAAGNGKRFAQTPGQPSDSSRHAGLFTDISQRANTRREPMTRQASLPISTR